jgi:hypothetical protein
MAGPLLGHVLGDRGLPDLNAELKQLTMDPWRAPKQVSQTDIVNEPAYLERCLWPARARS